MRPIALRKRGPFERWLIAYLNTSFMAGGTERIAQAMIIDQAWAEMGEAKRNLAKKVTRALKREGFERG